jgi:hypothetical protein
MEIIMIDIFTILANANSINGISITDLTDLFVNNKTNVYDIAMIGKGKVILKSKEENKFEKLDCVCSYFDTEGCTDCNDIKQNIMKIECSSCKECYKCALQKLDKGELSLK